MNDHPEDVVEVDFDGVPDANLVPEGRYLVRVKELVSKQTEAKDLMWNLRLEIVRREDGSKQSERRIIFDNLVFSKDGMSRVKLVCGVLGIATKGRVALKPSDFLGRHAWIDVAHKKDNKGEMRDGVPFRGWHAYRPDEAGPPAQQTPSSQPEQAAAQPVTAPQTRRDDIPF